jgi:DNA-binding beta-propeller fold protein YncE
MRPTRTLLACSLLVGACSAEYGMNDKDASWGGDADSDVSETDWNSPIDDSDEPPSESEVDFLSLAPDQTDVYVFITNPERGTVTRVNVRTLDVRTTTVGARPSVARVTRDYTTAVVFNQGDATVSILDAETLDQEVVPVRGNLNSMALSPDGRWAALWHAVAAERPDDPAQGGATSFNEVSLVDLMAGLHVPLVVGFNPKAIEFTPDGSLALVVSDASLAVLRLTDDLPVPEFIEVADPLDPPLAEEAVITPDGTWAFIRQFGTEQLTVVDLDAREVSTVPVGSNPTDIDLTPDGLHAVVVSRDAATVSIFDVADPFASPEVLDIPGGTRLGAVAMAPSQLAVLYTTASLVSRYATWDLDSGEIRLRPLAKPVAGIARTPTGDSLLVVHTRADAADGSTEAPYRGKPAISLVDLDDFRANTLALADDVLGIANSNNGRFGYVILEDQPYMEVLDYTTLIFEELPLRSTPVFVGALPDLDPDDGDEPPAWVSQEHPLGRISFYDPDDDAFETITGFELNSAIED